MARSSVHRGIVIAGLAVLGAAAARAQEAPPEIPDNPGVPGLLAEISRLSRQLISTNQQLLTARSELAQTHLALDETTANLEVSQLALDEALETLEREKNRYRVPRTGQEKCWEWTIQPDTPHYATGCAGTGQDGEKLAGLAPPFTRFVDNDDGTITDRFTMLVWLRRQDCFNGYSWFNAIGVARQLSGLPEASQCGLRDGSLPGQWRMPNVNELLSLVDYESYAVTDDPNVPHGSPFMTADGERVGGIFWSSTTLPVPEDAGIGDRMFPTCFSGGYGQDNFWRFNEAYVVDINIGTVEHVPKQHRDSINRRYRVDNCIITGFENGTPRLILEPRFIAVRNLVESAN